MVMTRSSLRSRGGRRDPKTARKWRRLRAEPLEPRLTLSVTLSPIANAYVLGTTPYANYGGANNLLVQNDSNMFTPNDAESYLKFDLTSVSGTVSKAVLNLTPLSVGTAAKSMTVGVQLLSDSNDGWVEGTGGTNRSWTGPITWMNSPYGFGQEVTIPGSQFTANTPISIDVTSLVNQKFNANHIASFIIGVVSRPGSGEWADFASREYTTNTACDPTLTVTTSGPVNPPPTVTGGPTVTGQTSTTAGLSVTASPGTSNDTLTYTWSAAAVPSGASAPTFTNNGTVAGANTTATFSRAGTYSLDVKVTESDGVSVVSSPVSVIVSPALTSITVTPASTTVATGGSTPFTLQGVDQFKQPMAIPSADVITWSAADASGPVGSFTGSGTSVTYLAPGTADIITITAKVTNATQNLSLSANSSVTVVKAGFLGLQDPLLASLVETDDTRDGSINRADMIGILNAAAGENATLNSTDFTDLQTIYKDAATLAMPQYVKVLFGDIINGNPANAQYLGKPLGNLAVGSTTALFDDLIGKWFLGTDLPATGGYSYDASTAGTLFGPSGVPSHNDELQGELGDCYLISSLGTLADASQGAAISNMIISNGDGTWTVRFYTSSGTADYVTVNSQLPVSGTTLIFDGYGESDANTKNSLWIPLLEKAYAEWNATGNEGRSPAQNSYASIAGGWMADVDAQVLGHAASSYDLTSSSDQQALVNAFTTPGKTYAVTIGTDDFNYDSATGLYGDHAYAVIGYTPAQGSSPATFTLYNPWGMDQPPTPLTWAQLQKVCDGFVVADPSGTQPISAAKAAAVVVHPVVISPAPLIAPIMVPMNSAGDAANQPTATAVVAAPADSQGSSRLEALAVDLLMADREAAAGTDSAATGNPFQAFDAEGSLSGLARSGDNAQLPDALAAVAADETLPEA
jgi:hypothetical protein